MAASTNTFPFLALSAELRNSVYEYCLEWPNPSIAYQRLQKSYELQNQQPDQPPLSPSHLSQRVLVTLGTPALLLLNRQISFEALTVIYRRTFALSAPPPLVSMRSEHLGVTAFISPVTLQRLRYVMLDMNLNFKPGMWHSNAKRWLNTMEKLLCIWTESNVLERLRVKTKYVVADRSLGWTFEQAAHHRNVLQTFIILRDFEKAFPQIFEKRGHDVNLQLQPPI
ncbi:hypothetical protein BJ875DRAFT_443627 [Amylocarpus encephaloides]|uniref:Uncharacterized protein n=1 Tax=Amylocarpus encephaloides TaxID=45428 RepID=A0A9P7YEM0_9HELO|nr:hypothetical protein BJ875DRAFT_443627 [Amylocarpus encephaloides]